MVKLNNDFIMLVRLLYVFYFVTPDRLYIVIQLSYIFGFKQQEYGPKSGYFMKNVGTFKTEDIIRN